MTDLISADQPIARRVLRHYCPHCGRSRAHKQAAIRHMARCFKNPAARACLTCAAFEPGERADHLSGYPGCPRDCGHSIDISEHLAVHCEDYEAYDDD